MHGGAAVPTSRRLRPRPAWRTDRVERVRGADGQQRWIRFAGLHALVARAKTASHPPIHAPSAGPLPVVRSRGGSGPPRLPGHCTHGCDPLRTRRYDHADAHSPPGGSHDHRRRTADPAGPRSGRFSSIAAVVADIALAALAAALIVYFGDIALDLIVAIFVLVAAVAAVATGR